MIVQAYEKGLLFRNGRLVRLLEPGRYWIFWFWPRERVEKVDLRDRTLTIVGQEMMTADKIAVRTNVVAKFRVADPVAAILKNENYGMQLYTDVQLALREAVAARTLDELIAEKAALGARVLEALKLEVEGYGIALLDAAIKDLVLPGEIRAAMNRVLEARKDAEAALIRRREEVAATRQLANTAALLEKNPVLMKLKVLEVLEAMNVKVTLPPEFLKE